MVGYVGTHGTNPAVRKLPYDAIRDFTAIAMVGGTRNVLVVHPSVPAADLRSFVDYARNNAGKLNYATGGIGLRSEEHTSELQSHSDLVCRLLLEKKKKN